jgi:acetyltransferase-like isoleucine patch superfamily enzyme
MFYFLKRFYWDWKDPKGRFKIINSFLMHAPGRTGVELRRKVIPKYLGECGENIVIHPGVRLRGPRHLKVGSNVEIGFDNFLQASGGLTLGDDVMTGPGVKIWTVNHKFDAIDQPIREQGYGLDPVHIGQGVWLGANVFIFPGVELPQGCVVSANSVVIKKKYPPYALLAGYPARVIGSRQPAEPAAPGDPA